MKHPLALLIALFTVFAMVGHDDADARRMGGGRSLGAQRSFTPAPAPSPHVAPNPVMPAPSGMANARPATPAAAGAAAAGAAPRAGASRWLAPLAGVAAGLGLAALFSHLGLSQSLGSLLLILLLVGGGVLLIRALMARRMAPGAPLRYAPQGPASTPAFDRVEPTASRFEPAWGGGTPSAAAEPRRFPPGFDPAPFLAEAKRQFIRLQQAYDRNDRSMLADVLTPQMQDEIGREIDARSAHVATEVVALDGEVLEVTTEAGRHFASVRFTGQTREDGRSVAEPFDEVWNLVKPVDGSSGWRLAGIQQYA